MKKLHFLIQYTVILLCIFLFSNLSAQTGLNFQGVARTTNNIIIASQDITLKLSILQGTTNGIPEYVEIRKVRTNAQGLFTAVIGDAEVISTVGKFTDIDWKLSPKFLKIELDPTAGNNFITMGTTQFQYVAYAKFANSVLAENISGIVPVARGGTGSNSLPSLKSALALDNVSNISDLSKPISNATQTALDQKLNIADSTSGYITPSKLASYNFTKGSESSILDTISIINRINTKANITDLTDLTENVASKLNVSDTSSFLRKVDTSSLSNRIILKLNSVDTISLSNRIDFKLNISDTASLLKKTQVGAINGVPSLDALGKIPSIQIPAISFSSVDVVNSQADMLGFTTGTGLATDRLVGSIVVRLDSSKNFVLANLPASNRVNWVELVNPDAPVKTVNGLTGYVDLRKANISDLVYVDNTSDRDKAVSDATKDSLRTRLYITDTSLLLKKSDTSFLLQKVDTSAILAMYAKKFTKDVKINGTSLGKYANGATIPAKGKTLDEFLEDLVSNSIPPSFSAPSVSIGSSPGATSYEIGYNPGSVTLSSTFSKNDGGNATSTMFYKNGVALGSGVNTNSPGALTSSVGYSVIVNYAAGTGTKNDNLLKPFPNTITAGSTSASLSFSTFSKRYWGGISVPFNTTTIYDITALSPLPSSDNSGGSKSKTTDIIITGTQYAYYAYPATNADLISIMYNNFESINTFTKTIVQIKNTQGYTQNYKVYTSNDPISATLTSITFN